MVRSGLVSVTYRGLSPERVVALARAAGLEAIEWGGDVHVPHGDVARARDVRAQTESAGLRVAAYGSYYRAASPESPPFAVVRDTAAALGAPTIRVWAGTAGSRDTDALARARVVEDLRRIASQAEEAGIGVSLEFHGGTLTDTADSTLRLREEVDHPNLGLYWQPDPILSHADRLAGLERLSPYVTNVHVFQWSRTDGETRRHPLAEGEAEWREYLGLLSSAPGDRDALLEFVPDDDPAVLAREAATLKGWIR